MAIAPFPFFYSPPYACPSAAAYPPPTPGSFPAPAYDPYSFSSAATYHQPPHFTSPAFPYAATYPYPPPPSSFSPNWPIWPPPAPSPLPYPSTFSTTTTSFTLTSGCVRFPQPPLAETPAMAPTSRPDQAPGAPLAIDLSSLTPQPLDSIPTVTSRKHCKSRTPQADLFYSKPIKVTRGHASTGRTISELHVHEIPCVMKNKGSAYLPAPATKDTDCFNHASEVTSSAPTSRPQFFSSNTKGTGFGLSASSTPTAQASYFGFIASGSTTTSVSAPSTLPDTGPVVCGSSSPAHLFSNTTTSSPATTAAMALSMCSSSLERTSSVYVAPKLSGQMATPRSGYEHYCGGHQNQNPIQSSRVDGGSTNLSEQNLDWNAATLWTSQSHSPHSIPSRWN